MQYFDEDFMWSVRIFPARMILVRFSILKMLTEHERNLDPRAMRITRVLGNLISMPMVTSRAGQKPRMAFYET